MTPTTKPRTGGQPERGLKRGTARILNCLNPTTSTRTIQLFVTFNSDTMNAVIALAREVS